MQHVLSQLISKRAELKAEMNYLLKKANKLDKIIENVVPCLSFLVIYKINISDMILKTG